LSSLKVTYLFSIKTALLASKGSLGNL